MMNRPHFILPVVGLLLLLAASGCGAGAASGCTCEGGETCVDGECVSLCNDRSNCEVGEICTEGVCAEGSGIPVSLTITCPASGASTDCLACSVDVKDVFGDPIAVASPTEVDISTSF